MLRPIILLGAPILRTVSSPVTAFDDTLHELLADLWTTMHLADGAGLSANQVGVALQVAVITDVDGSCLGVANPVVEVLPGGDALFQEGCLSIPNRRGTVRRPRSIHLKYQNENGNWVTRDLTGMTARVAQHEVDHLHGILFIDHLERA